MYRKSAVITKAHCSINYFFYGADWETEGFKLPEELMIKLPH
jgi:hypothetical protein